jgi:4-hydroxybenzoate polyprenyltransferase
LLAFRQIDPKLPYLAVASFLLWLIYSLPSGAKSRPIWGTAIHFLSQIVQFHLGIIVFSQVTWSSFLVSIYFAIIFACGHLMHELKDFEADRAAGIRTNVVAYGQRTWSPMVRAESSHFIGRH